MSNHAGAEFDGVPLPPRMTVECAREMVRIIHEHERASHYDEGDAPSAAQTAVKLFEAVLHRCP